MKVYLVEPIHPLAYDYLKSYVDITDQLSEADGLITRNFRVDATLLEQAKKLKVVGVHGTGINDIDLHETSKRKIRVFNAPNQNSLSVAEMNISLMMLLTKKLKQAINYYPNDVLAPISLCGNELSNKVVGFVGLGNIALKTAKMLYYGFDCTVLGYSRSSKGIDYIQEVSLDKLCQESDYIVLGVGLNESTRGMINLKLLKQMKRSAFLINTTRGPVVNEDDLIEALENKWIAGYGSDVFDHEPNIDPRLYQYNVVMTPHIAASTDEALYRVGMLTVKQMVQALHQEEVEYEIKGE